jgi:hypothetical protein
VYELLYCYSRIRILAIRRSADAAEIFGKIMTACVRCVANVAR